MIIHRQQAREPATGHGRGYAVKRGLAFAAIYLVWGSTYLAIRYSVETIPPLLTAGIRFSVAGAILFAWAWARGFRPKREHWMAGAVVGALFFLVSHGMLYWAEQTVASGQRKTRSHQRHEWPMARVIKDRSHNRQSCCFRQNRPGEKIPGCGQHVRGCEL